MSNIDKLMVFKPELMLDLGFWGAVLTAGFIRVEFPGDIMHVMSWFLRIYRSAKGYQC